MALKEKTALISAADSYCVYLAGFSVVANGPAAAEVYYGREISSEAAILDSTETMYKSAKRMLAVGAQARLGIDTARDLLREPIDEVDEELVSFAVEAIDLAFDKYSGRIRQLGIFTVPQEVLRPCILKRPEGVSMVRQSRADRLTPHHFVGDMIHDVYESLGSVSLTELRAQLGHMG